MTGFLFVQSINAFLKAGVFRKGGVLVMLKLGFDEASRTFTFMTMH